MNEKMTCENVLNRMSLNSAIYSHSWKTVYHEGTFGLDT